MDPTLESNVVTTTISDDRRPSMAVIERCARLEGVDPVDLDPLYDTIDPDVLDSVCEAPGFSSLEFTYCGREVTLRSTGADLEISIAEGATPSSTTGTVSDGEPSL